MRSPIGVKNLGDRGNIFVPDHQPDVWQFPQIRLAVGEEKVKGRGIFSTRAGGKHHLLPNQRSTFPMWFHIKPSWFWVKLMPKVSKNITRTPKNVFP